MPERPAAGRLGEIARPTLELARIRPFSRAAATIPDSTSHSAIQPA